MSKHNIVIAGRSDSADMLNKLATSLRGSARLSYAGENPVVSLVTDIESVKEYVSDGDVTALIVADTISSITNGADITISQSFIKEWRTKYPSMLVVLVVDANKKGGVKLKKLFDEGYYNALYISDLKQNNIIDLITKDGRVESEAYKYYGLGQAGSVTGYEPPAAVVRPPVPSTEEPVLDDDAEPDEYLRPRRKKNLAYKNADGGLEDDIEEPRRVRPARDVSPERPEDRSEKADHSEKPVRRDRPRRKRSEDFEAEYDEDEYDEDYDTPIEYDEYEDEDYEEQPRRRRGSHRTKKPKKTVVYPMPEDCKLYFGEVEDIDPVENVLYVKLPIQGENVVLDDSFIGTQVFFVIQTEEE